MPVSTRQPGVSAVVTGGPKAPHARTTPFTPGPSAAPRLRPVRHSEGHVKATCRTAALRETRVRDEPDLVLPDKAPAVTGVVGRQITRDGG
ncbi:hypothetical protein SSTG_05701 [Streptomyces sp. e14]|nr:hypothetical protein SSTG_05701 [Streptomyces sp. e14]